MGQGQDGIILRWLDQPPPKRRRVDQQDVELEDNINLKRPQPHMLGPKLLAKFPKLADQPPHHHQHKQARKLSPSSPEPQQAKEPMLEHRASADSVAANATTTTPR